MFQLDHFVLPNINLEQIDDEMMISYHLKNLIALLLTNAKPVIRYTVTLFVKNKIRLLKWFFIGELPNRRHRRAPTALIIPKSDLAQSLLFSCENTKFFKHFYVSRSLRPTSGFQKISLCMYACKYLLSTIPTRPLNSTNNYEIIFLKFNQNVRQ